MNPKEKENNQEEELKTQATPNECDEETVGQETSQEMCIRDSLWAMKQLLACRTRGNSRFRNPLKDF